MLPTLVLLAWNSTGLSYIIDENVRASAVCRKRM